mmetsp:Transcript_11251/g.14671  ORF Transcript_11251/g.14671 Transcript_11251/m.14671 type:complete len:347 (-) Transcript_11251:1129-2169(-)
MSYGSYRSNGSNITLPVRVSVYLNGANGDANGRRVVLDRTDSLQENILRVARKLRMERMCTQPLLYTEQGILVEEVEEVIEGEIILFEPRGKPFKPVDLSKNSTVSSSEQSGMENLTTTNDASVELELPASAGTDVDPIGEITRKNSLDYDYMFKFIIVGNTAVGKSCLLLRFTDHRFVSTHETTIGVDFGTQIVDIHGKGAETRSVKIQIWDTAGQEDFQAITRAYYREAAAALVVYDIFDRKSFEEVRNWIRNVKQSSTNRALTIALVGNKCDLVDGKMSKSSSDYVSSQEGEMFARENGLLFFETSAKSGENVAEAFSTTASAVLRKVDLGLVDTDNLSQGKL